MQPRETPSECPLLFIENLTIQGCRIAITAGRSARLLDLKLKEVSVTAYTVRACSQSIDSTMTAVDPTPDDE